jgi:hypothetical protein
MNIKICEVNFLYRKQIEQSLIKMKFSKETFLVLVLLFTIDFTYSLFNELVTHELFFWKVNIWIYRIYQFVLSLFFIALYFKQRIEDLKNIN